ncbi:RNA recognition motif domain and RNA recognition motif domain, eukaryote and Nucleotide-binding, alpha-beta plait domain-containing protein [Strongyloides ratti]|uniref:RNA recognition motif domain and RNA recognition motif domain, eukaryote and Nucleotide-binding, alpha-beta plait domain-containing protein n=1 Tax=Strongyloides ratti TaxID=34506 RepID=A0A090L1E9_STRRB|nr:RNA recognition motif domain and RNA recognition motif domain, eukaryote and Nucleotide-binding, alpha-beta plait domain-containing protein [Strongyloides ratti]CEF61284.1 RNA recognition motif domain and RNA recognition motif domain, eukaryote and Nucleotide-binding, alpha-beta plait domain-containing protein [Strongyloides ratti]
MSRVIVKGLPKNCTEEQLKKFFKDYGTLTDCKLKYSSDGIFRQFGFVGFESEDLGKKAIKKLNGTFMGTSKVVVEECKSFSDENKPRAWSKYSKESSAYKRLHPDESPDKNTKKIKLSGDDNGKSEMDPKYEEFLKFNKINISKPDKSDQSQKEPDIEILKNMILNFTGNKRDSLIFRGLPSTIKQVNFKEWLSPIKFKSLEIKRGNQETFMIVTFEKNTDLRRALKRDNQYLGGDKIRVIKFAEQQGKNTKNDKKEESLIIKQENEKLIEEQTQKILDTGRLFVRNLPYLVEEADIRAIFIKYGEIADCEVIIDKKTGRNKGYAMVTFVFPENAVDAFTKLDGTIFKGRMLHILPGEEKTEKSELQAENQFGLSKFQKEKQAKLKTAAGKTYSWNILFLGANAVAETLAKRLEVEKSEILTGEGDNTAGVKLALAETALVRETRDFLIKNGVKLDSFSNPAAKRSKTVIIAKNLPSNFNKDELRRMFAYYGDVKDVLMPSEHSVSALVIMGNPVDAKAAFSNLAYSRVRSQPLYLEWAPYDVFENSDDSNKPDETEDLKEVENKKKAKKGDLTSEEKKILRRSKKHQQIEEDEKQLVNKEEFEEEIQDEEDIEDEEEIEDEDEEELEDEEDVEEEDLVKKENDNEDFSEDIPEHEDNARVFVKNLNFETTDETLYKEFSKKYNVHSATVSRKIDVKTQKHTLSMGFGFVQFYTNEDAIDAVKTLQGMLIDGHSIELKLSIKEKESIDKQRKTVDQGDQGECTKIMVRNISFAASIKEIRALFQSFGNVKDVRIPKKMGSGGHRGFGFVEYMSKSEAKHAFESLVHSTHFYGRRLVLEWAHEDKDEANV